MMGNGGSKGCYLTSCLTLFSPTREKHSHTHKHNKDANNVDRSCPRRVFNFFISTSMGQKSFCCHHDSFPEGNAETKASLSSWGAVEMTSYRPDGMKTERADCNRLLNPNPLPRWAARGKDGSRHHFLTPLKSSVKNSVIHLWKWIPLSHQKKHYVTAAEPRWEKQGAERQNTQCDVHFFYFVGAGAADWSENFTVCVCPKVFVWWGGKWSESTMQNDCTMSLRPKKV